jgi:hypothetical protein
LSAQRNVCIARTGRPVARGSRLAAGPVVYGSARSMRTFNESGTASVR